jgi:pyruvate dehydrogenase E2 component (dihydrolipoamide acetyltransferase)
VAVEIVMPRLSDAMEEGTIVQWFVAPGDRVLEGMPLVEVETDKATVTYESEHEGTVLALNAEVGASVAVGAPLAVVGEPGDELPASAGAGARAPLAASGDANAVLAAPPPAPRAGEATPSTPGEATPSTPGEATPSTPGEARVKASPLARRIAAELGVELATLVGSGPNGRVIRADVEGSTSRAPAVAKRAGTESGAGSAKGEPTRRELTRVQRTIARRMAESRATVPDFELRCEVDMSQAVAVREQLRALCDPPPSYNDLIVKAAALALTEYPRVNGSYRDAEFESYPRVNIGIAVAAQDALVVPTIFDADRKTVAEIAAESQSLAARVRDGSVTPGDLSGGTFSISNLGMFGVDSFSAVINPPQAAILAVGSLKPRPVVDAAGVVVARPTINLTLACDHRILYGADGARFLARVRELLEQPVALLL